MKWVTGPAGVGKTAVLGSVTERCKKNGFPVICFFFSSTGSIRHRTKTAFVTTIAYQLAQHGQDLKNAITAAIEADTIVFKKHLHAQMETLVLSPLRAVTGVSDTTFQGVIVVDGLDECEVEEIHDNTTTGSRPKSTRTKEQDQLEILHVLHHASSDPRFPFRIIVSSRPEPVIRHFFDPESHPAPIARTLDLHKDYSAEADIILVLEAYFIRLCRQHKLPPSWLPPNAVKILVDRASGRFSYAEGVKQIFERCHEEPFPRFFRLMPPGIFDRTRDFSIDDLVNFDGHPSANTLRGEPISLVAPYCDVWLILVAVLELQAHMAPEGLHDSAERCDAPKCHPETRVAVQNDLYNWIEHGDAINPSDMKWVTGPAGSGKTAVLGSVTERCKKNGFPVASFFFSSLGSIGRRTKTAFVATIAYQLAEQPKFQALKDAIAVAIEADKIVFNKSLCVQMDTLVLAPLRAVAGAYNAAFRGAIVIDGLDECGVEKIHDDTANASQTVPTRTKDQDQLEILQVLHQASSDPTFPFRIIIASRPERVFRHFFDPERQNTPIAHKLDLHQDYDAEADITLFLKARFDHLRRIHNLPPSWLPPNAIKILVDKASGQFIYAVTVIRFLELGHRAPSKALLEAILRMEATGTSNPLNTLDELYSHILNSSPDPLLSVRWIRVIRHLQENGPKRHSRWAVSITHHLKEELYACDFNLLLQTDPASNEVEHLLGNLHSLIRIPPPRNEATTAYGFYHKSLFDFLEDPDRCGKLHIRRKKVLGFLWDRIHGACASEFDIVLVSLSVSDITILKEVTTPFLQTAIEACSNSYSPFQNLMICLWVSHTPRSSPHQLALNGMCRWPLQTQPG
jgi:nucleoside-triphosphatase THEP1